jgi:hypothetical protein
MELEVQRGPARAVELEVQSAAPTGEVDVKLLRGIGIAPHEGREGLHNCERVSLTGARRAVAQLAQHLVEVVHRRGLLVSSVICKPVLRADAPDGTTLQNRDDPAASSEAARTDDSTRRVRQD